jgi:phospholipase C
MNTAELKDNIDTIFIVMLENRSFDHVLGAKFAFPPVANPSSRDATRQFPPRLEGDQWIDTDLPHGRPRIATSLEAGMRGFVHAYEDELGAAAATDYCPPMWYLRPDTIPVTHFFADNFRVCHRWHASLPCDTFPNRLMAMSGAALIDDTSVLDPTSGKWLPDQYTVLEWAVETIKDRPPFQICVDWHSIPGIGYPSTFYLMKRLHPFLAGRECALDTLAQQIDHWDRNSTDPAKRPPAIVYCEPFFNDLAIKLPVVNLHGTCNHPPLPMAFGESFLSRVYAAVTHRPEVWAHSLLLVVYDEHGGFFDHVHPPAMVYPQPAGGRWLIKDPIQTLGLRVPAFLISPFTPATPPPGKPEDDLLFDHTSILQLVVDRFGSPADLARFGHAQTRAATVKSVREALGSVATVVPPPPAPAPPPSLDPPDLSASHEGTSGIAEIWGAHLND